VISEGVEQEIEVADTNVAGMMVSPNLHLIVVREGNGVEETTVTTVSPENGPLEGVKESDDGTS
jgi:hypothetical protein